MIYNICDDDYNSSRYLNKYHIYHTYNISLCNTMQKRATGAVKTTCIIGKVSDPESPLFYVGFDTPG